MTIDQYISVIASLGTVLAGIATFLTVQQVAKQRRASYRPELVFQRVYYLGEVDRENQNGRIARWSPVGREPSASNSQNSRRLRIALLNIGLAAAQNISIRWSFPIDEAARLINDLAQTELLSFYVKIQNGTVEARMKNPESAELAVWRNEQIATFDYIIPFSRFDEDCLIDLPWSITLIYSSLIYVGYRPSSRASAANRDFQPPNLPPITALLEYDDISGERHRASFKIEATVTYAMDDRVGLRMEPRRLG